MYLLVTPFTFLALAVFIVAVIAFLLAVRFFVASQKRLKGLIPDRKKKEPHFTIGIDRDGFLVPSGRQIKKTVSEIADVETKEEMKELRNMLQLQQLELTRALRQIESLHTAKQNVGYDDDDFEEKEDVETEGNNFNEPDLPADDFLVEELRNQLTRKDAEIKDLQQQAELNQKLQVHFEDIQANYDELQEKVQKMEAQAWQSAELAVKVDDLEQAVDQFEKTAHKKEERIRELTMENGRLHNLLNQTEDKLSEAALQRQQLFKKVHFLEEVNTDIQQMSETNRKLKTELRRVAELESMLGLITEERDALLKRRRV